MIRRSAVALAILFSSTAFAAGNVKILQTWTGRMPVEVSPLVQSSGGELVKLAGRHFYLIMGHVFQGSYTAFEGQGEHTFEAGACWLQPPKIKHTVRGYSDDCELLEIIMPADFATVTLK